MSYIIEKIVPYNISGSFKRYNFEYQFDFTHSIPNLGHLYVYGSNSTPGIENLFILPSLVNRNFKSVYDKIDQIYAGNQDRITTRTQYQISISNQGTTKYINVYFTDTFNKVVLSNNREITINEDNIYDFLQNINNYKLE